MKKVIGLLFVAGLMALAYLGHVEAAIGIGFLAAAVSSTPVAGVLASGLDVSGLASTLVKWGGQMIMKSVNAWDPGSDFMIAKNVKIPLPLPRLSTTGEPRLYRSTQDAGSNSIDFTDRVLTVRQSKWDHIIDPEVFRNTYLAEAGAGFDPNEIKFPNYVAAKLAEDYLANLNDKVILDGVYNGSGTGTVDIMDGLVELLTNMGLTPVATGAITSANAVTKVELVAAGVPAWMRSAGFKIICSWKVYDYYKIHYRTLNPFGFNQDASKSFRLDGYNATLEPRSYMNDTLGIFAVPTTKKNLWLGTDGDSIAIHATPNMNVINCRLMMPIGMQIADADAVVINDQF